jgi:hypothetical protein
VILVDDHEPAALDLYLHTLNMPTERLLLNRPAAIPRPDYGWHLPDGRYLGVSRKQAGEFIGGIDACEAQLLDEMGGCDYMALIIEGRFKPTAYGNCYVYEMGVDYVKANARKPEMAYGTTQVVRREFRQSYKGVRQKLARFCDLGIYVLETHDLEDTAYCLAALYTEFQKPEASLTTFKRLIPDKYRLDEPDAAKKRFALQLMGAVPGVGEEIALAIAESPNCRSMRDLMDLLTVPYGNEGASIASLPLRSGKRTIGPAAVKKIAEALGCQ